jgi:hypothetical protein
MLFFNERIFNLKKSKEQLEKNDNFGLLNGHT